MLDVYADIDVLSRLRKYQISSSSIKSMAAQVLASQKECSCVLAISFVAKAKIKQLNKDYRSVDKPTDVLAFPQGSSIGEREDLRGDLKVLGDVVICPDVASSNANRIGHSLDREVSFLLVHGVLHLCGYDHQTESEAALMFAQQRRVMAAFDQKRSWLNCIRSGVNGGS